MPKRPQEGFQGKPAKPRVEGARKTGEKIAASRRVFDDPFGRAQYFRRTRVGADGRVLRAAIAKGSASKRRAERRMGVRAMPPTPPGGPGTVNWVGLGPTKVDGGQAGATHAVVSGRVTSIAVGPGGSRAYVGTANGGVWRTEDGGTTWSALDEFANTPPGGSGGIANQLETDSLAVGAVTVTFGAARANDVVFVGTGEPGAGVDGYFGIGIKSSTDGGTTFTLEATNLTSTEIYRIVVDPDNPALVFAATTGGLYQRPSAAPFTSWNQITGSFTNANGPASDVIIAGKGGSKAYYVAFDSDTVYKSTDSGVTWNAVPGFSGSGRIVLAAGENDASVVYALVEDGTLNRMDSGTGGNFQQVSGVPRALFAGHQGFYDLVVAADPSDANTIYLVGDLTLDTDWALSIYKGKITGGPGSFTFPFNSANDQTNPTDASTTSNVPSDPTWIGRGIHPDGHTLAFATNANGTHDGSIVWVGSDGGVFVSASSGTLGSFSAKNQGINITQMTYIAQRPDTADILYGGCQDNGTIRFSLAGTKSWLEVVEGDGGGVAIDPNTPQQVIRQYVRADLSVTGDDGSTWASAGLPVASGSVEDFRSGFYGPVKALAAGSKTVVAFGTNRLWFRTDWNDPWKSLPDNANTDVLDDPNPTVMPSSAQPTRVPVTAIAIASGTRVYAATSQVPAAAGGLGQVWHFEFASGAWTKQALPAIPGTAPSVRFFTALAVEDPNAGTLYVTLGSGGGEHVFYFDGTSWVNAAFSATNVDVPTHAVTVDPDNPNDVYVGTDVGVWKGTRSGTSWTWTPFSQGLPEAAITDLTVHSGTRKLRAATHGRGVWEIALQPAGSSSSSGASSSSSGGSSSSSDSSSSGGSSSSSDSSSSSGGSSSSSSSSSSGGSSSSSDSTSSSGDSSSSSDSSSSGGSSSSSDSTSSSGDSSSSSDSSSSGGSSSSSDSTSSSGDSSSSSDSSSSGNSSSSSDSTSSSGDSSSSSDSSSSGGSSSSSDSTSSSDSSSDSSGDASSSSDSSSSSDGGSPSTPGGKIKKSPQAGGARGKQKRR